MDGFTVEAASLQPQASVWPTAGLIPGVHSGSMILISLGREPRVAWARMAKVGISGVRERRRFEMDSSSGTKGRGGWTWKAWLGIALGIAVLVAVILIAANAGGGSTGIY